MRKKLSLIALLALLISILPSQKTFALSCASPPSHEVAIHDYDVVVIAQVSNVESNDANRTIKADVSYAFKGYNENKITFTEDSFWGESQVGIEYLLFLNKKGNGFESPLCSPTTLTTGIDIDGLKGKLAAEEEIAFPENSRTTPTVNKSVKATSESKISLKWSINITTPIILIVIIAIFYYRREKIKRIGGR